MSWTRERERGGAALRLMAWIARRMGWRFSYALLLPVTAWFMLSAPAHQREAVRRFQRRALGREPGWPDLWRPYFAFAATMLDRVYLLQGRTAGFRITVTGLEALDAHIAAGRGCVLLGAHLGSFEAMRALADRGCPVEVMAFMYEANARLANAVFSALSPEKAERVVALGRPDSMLRAKECLDRGGLVGILADRRPAVGEDRVVPVPFLGATAPLPAGPHILAAVLGAPVMLAFGIWRGPRRYEIRFEEFAERVVLRRSAREADLRDSVLRYAARLEEVAREHPANWFNFYDFWEEMGAAATAAEAVPQSAPAAARRAVLALPLMASPAAAQQGGGLEAVMAALAAVRRTEADFVETKEIAGLADTLPSSGTLLWQSPSTLEKRVTDPFQERVVVSGDRLVYERPSRGERQEVNLDQAPEVRALVEAIRSTLAGDLATLRRFYEVSFEGALPAWTIVLHPLSVRVRAVVQRVEIRGVEGGIRWFQTVGNESSVMRVTPRS
ncbi:LolA-related protein [Muricoccus aerilatus]|uniref:LpxL/LpxP family acyltransferase n=1 Tax=Muricoccus aerilatus TaxID=452982 RepID=UPI000693E817|nr:LolA-related protein [Roseomonas aerilata]